MDFIDIDGFTAMFPNDKKDTERKLMELGVLNSTLTCRKCGEGMKIIEKRSKLVFRCRKGSCGKVDVSCRIGSVFFASKLSCRQILKVGRSWLQGESRIAAARSSRVNTETLTMWYMCFRELIATSLSETEQKIGGPGIVVQVDETKLGKRKFHRGHRV